MDSISKNTGCEYVICFAARLYEDPSQYARLPSTPGENSLFQYGTECNLDHAQFLLYCHQSENMGSVSIGGKEGSTSQSRAPSQTPRVGLISSSPPVERFHFLNFPESVFDKASQPRYGHRFGFGTSIDQNDGSTKSCSHDVKQGSRLLIDAYGGNDTSHEKLPKVQRLNAYQGMTNLQCNEEDMYACKNMSPILAIQGKELMVGPPRPNVGSNRQNAALPEKEFKTSRPSQPFLPRPDICANDLLKMQLLTYVLIKHLRRIVLANYLEYHLSSTGDLARARVIKEQGRGAAVTKDEVAAIYSSLLLLESLRTESKLAITMELSIVTDQQLRNAEGIARVICDRINLKIRLFFFFLLLTTLFFLLLNSFCSFGWLAVMTDISK